METTDVEKSQSLVSNDINLTGVDNVNAFLQFVQWIALPKGYREPKEQGELAVKFDVAPETLSRWKKHPLFWGLVQREFKEWAKDKTPNVMASLYNRALKEGNAAEVKLWMQIIEDWKEKSEQETKGIMKHYVISRGESRVEIIQPSPEAIGDSDSSGEV